MLRHYGAVNYIDPVKWRQKEIITTAQKKIGKRSFKMIERIFKEFIQNLDTVNGSGFSKLGMIIGDNYTIPQRDFDRLWERVRNTYGDHAAGIAQIKMILGTLLMLLFAEDPRYWCWEPDPEKKEKLINGENPEGNFYYKDPSSTQKAPATIDDIIKKFGGKKKRR